MNENGGTALLRDTRPEAQEAYFEILGKLTPEQRADRALSLTRTVHALAREGIRRRHPEYSDREVWQAMIRLCHGDEVFHKFFPGSRITP